MKCILMLVFLIGTSSHIYAETGKIAAANDFVISFLAMFSSIEVKPGELYYTHIPKDLKSSFMVLEESVDLSHVDAFMANYGWKQLKKLEHAQILQSNVLDNYACVFVYRNGLVGAFSLVNEGGWKLAEVGVSHTKDDMPYFCSFFYDELGIKNDAFLVLDERLILGSSDSKN